MSAAAPDTAAASAAGAAPAAPARARVPALPWNNVRYLLNRYCHDDPKKLNDFRLPELDALCEMAGAPVPCYSRADMLYSSPFLPARFPSEAVIRAMAKRAILVKGWLELWGRGSTLEAALAELKTNMQTESHLARWVTDKDIAYDVRVSCFGDHMEEADVQSTRKTVVDALGLQGHYRPNTNAHVQRFYCYIDVGSRVINPSRQVRQVYIARELEGCGDKGNTLEHDYRLNARKFLGPTSMPAGLSFIMSNLGHVDRRSVVFDPFVGTGSLLVSAGHFGSLCVGADLDWKVLHGKTRKGPISVFDNFKQYKLAPPEILCADLSINLWRTHGGTSNARAKQPLSPGFVDAIVCDPPYGVRARARRLGRAEKKTDGAGDSTDAAAPSSSASASDAAAAATPAPLPGAGADASSSADKIDEVNAGLLTPSRFSIPPTQVYDVEDVIHDLLDLSAQLLRLGGRLVYWLPTTTDFRNDELPAHPCFRQVSVGEQLVRSHFSRRLITMEKVLDFTPERRMKRRNKETDPPPKYANLKDSILALSEEGPDRNGLEFAVKADKVAEGAEGGDDAAAAAASSAAAPAAGDVDLAVAFAPRPLSNRSQKRLAKAESIRMLRAQIIESNGGKAPSRKERTAQKQRYSTSEWEEMCREKNKQVQQERARKQREAWQASQAAAGAEKDAGAQSSSPMDESAAGVAAAPAAAAAAASGAPSSPEGPPAKKARTEDAP